MNQLKHTANLTSSFSQVKWYRLYGRSSSGSNIKVRMNDKLYPGLAMEVEAGDPLTVSNLCPYEKYQVCYMLNIG